jgi:branched-chain amino acid transport system permease protein
MASVIEPVASDGVAAPVPDKGTRGLWSIPLLRHVVIGLALFLIGYFVISRVSPYRDLQLAEVFAYVVVIAALALLTGQNGQISLGHGALMMVGGYTATLVSLHLNAPAGIQLVAAGVAGLVTGLLFGLIAARLRGPYLAGATLALALALPAIPTQYGSIFGGDAGLVINQPSPPSAFGQNYTPQEYLASIGLLVVVVTFIVFANLLRSRYGRNFRVVRDDEVAAQISGISVARTQIIAFTVSAIAAAVGGALYTMVSGTVGPEGFTIALSISLLSAMVIGGLGTIYGAIPGAIILVYAPQIVTNYANQLHLSQGVSANLALGIYGVLLVVVMILFPQGIMGGLGMLWRQIRRQESPRRSVETVSKASEGKSPEPEAPIK